MTSVRDIKVGRYVLSRNEPSKVIKKEIVTVGTHMHSKTKLTVHGLFSGRTEILTLANHENVEEVAIINKKGQLVAKLPENRIQLMDIVSYETFTATVSGDGFNKLKEGDIVTFIEINGRVVVLESED